jgi:acetoacetyl-CoA synthetase
VRFTEHGTAVILGRSDSTLNRQGIRIGTAEIYRAVEAVPGVVESLVIGMEQGDGGYYMPLFVVLQEGQTLDEPFKQKIRSRIRAAFTARHLPDEIIRIDAVPRTHNGKKLEVPIKRILLGEPPDRALGRGSVANPESLRFFVDFAAKLGSETGKIPPKRSVPKERK